ncbi:uncharacterized protein LACBIDRAFT_293043 [Laccaria bicolor S238N-H82]|uniref:Predicted protein n=1 Tax=Laccaria bicolor (strain S238N-H82 / ATCC MYA-4686) TaxID=486041 RepID=B0D0D3_LACBS|nr:uncharacterized protein LACBIDRAFT_293043 [Laccaria bicolor S238N-H82]EDR11808.1 predicted protein [Laccaria bicolor S238N-H82]|eukprot:XP_001877705.1 predicted protein [Laccaria bicolor S238N-H82]
MFPLVRRKIIALPPSLQKRSYVVATSLGAAASIPRRLDASLGHANRARYNMQIMAASEARRLAECLVIAAQMKENHLKPDISTYNALMSAVSRDGNWLQAWAILDDMFLAQRQRSSAYMWNVLDKMDQTGVPPNAATCTHIIRRFVNDENLEMALQYLFTMQSHGLVPELTAAEHVITLAAQCNQPRLAIDLVNWFENISPQRVGPSVWMACLTSSAECMYVQGVSECWKVVHHMNVLPDEGLCVSILHTAARRGRPNLATDVLRTLKVQEIPWKEHHFASLVEAFTRNKQIKEAFLALGMMRSHEVNPIDSTSATILDAVKINAESVDIACLIIDEIYEEKKSVDLAALKVLIQAAVHLGDLQRALGTYRSLPDYNAVPDISIFNTLLDGCIKTQHRQVADSLLVDLKEANLKPNQNTYEKIIYLCLAPETYEDAFFYLEEMKAAGHLPPWKVYKALAEKCRLNNDARFDIIIEEMKEFGYDIGFWQIPEGRGPEVH